MNQFCSYVYIQIYIVLLLFLLCVIQYYWEKCNTLKIKNMNESNKIIVKNIIILKCVFHKILL